MQEFEHAISQGYQERDLELPLGALNRQRAIFECLVDFMNKEV
jgi:hypothetical protein